MTYIPKIIPIGQELFELRRKTAISDRFYAIPDGVRSAQCNFFYRISTGDTYMTYIPKIIPIGQELFELRRKTAISDRFYAIFWVYGRKSKF